MYVWGRERRALEMRRSDGKGQRENGKRLTTYDLIKLIGGDVCRGY